MIRKRTLPIIQLFLAGILLQTAIPSGYMPADINDGWFVKLCPQGMSADVMAAILGEHHHHHDDEATFLQCDLSGAIGATLAQSDTAHIHTLFAPTAVSAIPHFAYTGSNLGFWARPRAPPVARIALTFS